MLRITTIGLFCLLLSSRPAWTATVTVISPNSRPILEGKETDWIDGDFVLQNDRIIAVVANPREGRDANMTVRGVGACIIDLTRLDAMSDQLSAYYPAAGRFFFRDETLIESGRLSEGGVFWQCRSSGSVQENDTSATVRYELKDGWDYVSVNVTLNGDDVGAMSRVDGVRADRTFEFGSVAGSSLAYCRDEFFRQSYGFQSVGSSEAPTWGNDRLRLLRYPEPSDPQTSDRVSWNVKLYPASSVVDLWGLTRGAAAQRFEVTSAMGADPRIQLKVVEDLDHRLSGETPHSEEISTDEEASPSDDAAGLNSDQLNWRADQDGVSIVHLPTGRYRVRASAIGHEPTTRLIDVTSDPATHRIELGAASRATITAHSPSGTPLPCKITFYGRGNEDPYFGPDSADGSIVNCVYSVSGSVTRSLPAGSYDVVISHGPEYNAVFETLDVQPGEHTMLDATLERVVDTVGWVSAELHSHSSPSGDNTSSQLGRVQNLVCEQLEFAPCTEHQRIDSYDDQLRSLDAVDLLATCSGMELTGSPLPINHQNAFPLLMKPFEQSGGGPRTDADPIVQIQRLAMWDSESEKVVQGNHPTFPQMLRDRDLDGNPDGGFATMIDFMDVVEIHPPEDIFEDYDEQSEEDARRNRMYHWMRLIADGRRLPGVVNTDAHYNWHGSGWLRNWIRCSTDEPEQIDVLEMTHRLEAGQIVMSTGPFMTVQLHSDSLSEPAEIGDTVTLDGGTAELAVKIQCPNWLDVNRVQVFIGGRNDDDLTRTRRTHPDAFDDGVVKFDQRLPLSLEQDTFIIVAAIGEGLTLGRVMGPAGAERPPVVVSNPIYVNVNDE